jgi:signal transduction histidine kinase/ActR/RegA family two-component response regulator
MRFSDRARTAGAVQTDAVPILIVSDADERVGLLLGSIAGDPAHVSVVRSADDALRAATTVQPGIVVIAVALADEAAIELAAALKRVSSAPRVVMISMLESVASILTDPASPIDDVIPADTDRALLMFRLRATMQQRIQDADRQDRLNELLLLEELSRLDATGVDLDTALAFVTRRLVDLTGVDFAAISSIDTPQVYCAERGRPDASVGCQDRDIEALVTGAGERGSIRAAGVDPALLGPRPSRIARHLGLRTILPLPLTIEAQPWGTLLVGRRNVDGYTQRQAARLEHVAHLIGALVERHARRTESRSRDALVHDLMQPVTAALAMLEMLVADEALSPTGQVLAESMQRALSRVGRATSSSAGRAGPDSETMTEVDVRQVLMDAVGLIEHDYARQGLVLVRRLAPDLPPVRGDIAGLERIFVNLLVNAREAMIGRPGTVLLDAETCTGVDGEHVVVRVRDQGPGIAPAIRDRLFEPYCSTKIRDRTRGLGLSSCREIVARLGGSIDAESAEGQGASFRVVLPAVRSLAAVGVR